MNARVLRCRGNSVARDGKSVSDEWAWFLLVTWYLCYATECRRSYGKFGPVMDSDRPVCSPESHNSTTPRLLGSIDVRNATQMSTRCRSCFAPARP